VLLLKHLLLPACLVCLYPVGSAAQSANRFDIIITELMADPSPVVGLPNSEFIELKNNSTNAVSLQNWKIADGAGSVTISSNFMLEPDSFVIICSNASVAQFDMFGSVIGVSSFPSLNNDGEILMLYSPEGKIIHAIEYSSDWYQNDVKRDGGWSLEMIDTKNPCGGMNNWKACVAIKGGTPGSINSVNATNPDDVPPALLSTYTIDGNTIAAVFDEPLDSLSAAIRSNYTMDKNTGQPISVIPSPPLFKEVILKFPTSIAANTIYRLTVSNISDCAGNIIGAINTAPAGLPVAATSFDLVINEILFNPIPGGFDYIEIYNRSNKVINLKDIYLCNITLTGNLTNINPLSVPPKLFFPGEYLVFIENMEWLHRNYIIKNQKNISQLASLPSMPDEEGHIAVINRQGNIIDDLHYDKQWHFALIDNDEGISLERINYNDSTQNKNNWTSAASASRFGSPGYQNSQFRADLTAQGQVTVFPKVCSPDNSGIDDFIAIKCQLTEPGFVINITIFDHMGRPVRHLARNATAGITAIYNWYGLDDIQKKLPVGHYIILTEIVNLQGKTKKFKNVVTLAAKF
jgi:hypothetical protein